jgi:hypothetical protein
MSRLSTSTNHTQVPDTEQAWNTSTPPNDEESALPSKEKEKTQKDPDIVDWEGDNDQENPRNWSNGYKSWVTFQLGMLALCASLGSSITSPAQDAIAEYVGVSSEVVVLSVSLYM